MTEAAWVVAANIDQSVRSLLIKLVGDEEAIGEVEMENDSVSQLTEQKRRMAGIIEAEEEEWEVNNCGRLNYRRAILGSVR